MGRSSWTPSRINTVVEFTYCAGFVGRKSNIKKEWRSFSEKRKNYYWYHYSRNFSRCCVM